MKHKTKSSGKTHEMKGGYHRDSQNGKTQFNLMLLKGVPYEDQPLKHIADLYTRGAELYGARNFELAEGPEAMEQAKNSLLRHCVQVCCDDISEDHESAVVWNAILIMNLRRKQNGK